MPRAAKEASIDQVVRDAIAPVVAKAATEVARCIAKMAADELGARLQKAAKVAPRNGAAPHAGMRRPVGEITRWVANRRARRVPNFVKEMTGGLDTKKQIVAKYGPDSVFAKGAPAPDPRSVVGASRVGDRKATPGRRGRRHSWM
jgi:hypothetical protein